MAKVKFKTLKPVIIGNGVVPAGQEISLEENSESTLALLDTEHIEEVKPAPPTLPPKP
jgi:hypothetical protein